MTSDNKTTTREIVSGVIAGTMILTAVVYWIIQIQGVMEMLRLAAGE